MSVAYLTLSAANDTATVQSWLDAHSTATINFVQIRGFDVYIFYTE